MDNMQNLTPERLAFVKKIKIVGGVIIAICVMIMIIMFLSSSPQEEKKDDYSDYYNSKQFRVQVHTKSLLKEYVKWPDTFELEDINYTTATYETYEMWEASGYFTAENDLGMRVKSTYEVTLRYNITNDTFYKYKIIIDDVVVW